MRGQWPALLLLSPSTVGLYFPASSIGGLATSLALASGMEANVDKSESMKCTGVVGRALSGSRLSARKGRVLGSCWSKEDERCGLDVDQATVLETN